MLNSVAELDNLYLLGLSYVLAPYAVSSINTLCGTPAVNGGIDIATCFEQVYWL